MKLCIYCQTTREETRDHVPPKGLFPKPCPSNMITVPSCEKCNSSFAMDDEYFLNIALEWSASNSRAGSQIAAKLLRSMKRKKSYQYWQSFFAKTKPVEVRFPSGSVENSLEFRLVGNRIFPVINRIIRGLYYEITNTALPVNACVQSMLRSSFIEQHKDNPEALRTVQNMTQLAGRVIGQDTFEFHYALFDQTHLWTLWYLEFYRSQVFIGTTMFSGSKNLLEG